MSKFKNVLCSIVLAVVIIFVIKDSGISAKDIAMQSDTENMRVIATWNPVEKIGNREAYKEEFIKYGVYTCGSSFCSCVG